MANILNHHEIQSPAWKVLTLADGEAPERAKLPAGPVLVPVAVWQARREDLIRREWDQGVPFGLWLEPSDDIAAVAGDLGDFSVIGVNFPAFSDERGAAITPLLRTRYGYKGGVRALDDFSAAHQSAANEARRQVAFA